MHRIAKLLLVVLALIVTPLKQWAQTPYRQYADDGVELNLTEIQNTDYPPAIVFLTDGNWNDASKWSTGELPAPGSNVRIEANAIIPADYTVIANQVIIAEGGSLTIADGGQLKHNTNGLVVTMKKNIEAYKGMNCEDNYYLISFPFETPVAVPDAMTAVEGYDFYGFDPNYLNAEWRNNRQQAITTVGGGGTTGYLYAIPEDMELSLTGVVATSHSDSSYIDEKDVTIPYTQGSSKPSNGWALLGNPFTCDAYLYDDENNPMDFMVYNKQGELVTCNCGPIAPLEGFFVKVNRATTARIMCALSDCSFEEYFDIVILASPPEGGTVGGSGRYPIDTTIVITATANSGYEFAHWEDGNESNPRIITLEGDATYTAYFEPSEPTDSDWVDLGLPSGLLWATRNVGASSPEDYGDKFAWGETQPKSTYDWSTYQYCYNGNSRQLTKYCNMSSYGYNGFTDNLTILQPEDDAATANYGGRTPTLGEWQELRNHCSSMYTTVNGVKGRLFIGPNGNTLFLPFRKKNNYLGEYWSSSLESSGFPDDAWHFYFSDSYTAVHDYRRYHGLSVRAVRTSGQK